MFDANINLFPIRAGKPKAEGRHTYRFPKTSLSSREREICNLVIKGMRSKEVALQLGISSSTVDHHIGNAYRKLGVNDRTNLALHFAAPNAGPEVDNLPAA